MRLPVRQGGTRKHSSHRRAESSREGAFDPDRTALCLQVDTGILVFLSSPTKGGGNDPDTCTGCALTCWLTWPALAEQVDTRNGHHNAPTAAKGHKVKMETRPTPSRGRNILAVFPMSLLIAKMCPNEGRYLSLTSQQEDGAHSKDLSTCGTSWSSRTQS